MESGKKPSPISELVPERRLWPTQRALSELVKHGDLQLEEALLIMVRRDRETGWTP